MEHGGGDTGPLRQAIAELDGKIWFLGGTRGAATVHLVRSISGHSRWSLGPRLPRESPHPCRGVGGKLYMIGGEIEGASTGRPETFVANVWEHDPAVGGWVARAPMPTARSGGGKAVVDGKIYVAGGRPPGGRAFEVYDPATDMWEKLPDMPTQRNHLAMVALGGKIIVAGGRTGPGAMAERVDTVEISSTTGAGPRGTASGAGRKHRAAHQAHVVFGGEGSGARLAYPTNMLSSRANRWTEPDLPIAVHG